MMDEGILVRRRIRLGAAMASVGLDAVALVPGPAFYYLTGLNLHLMERPTILLVRQDGQTLALIPEIEKSIWLNAMPACDTVLWADRDGPHKALSTLLSGRGLRSIGVEALRMRVRECNLITEALPGVSISDAQNLVSEARICKEPEEIALIRRAIAISEVALDRVRGTIGLGMTEMMLKRNLIGALNEEGADGLAFDPIVLFGAASADPHGTSSDVRRLSPGNAVLIDFGASCSGYSADITRTWFARTCTDADGRLYEAVLAANTHGRAVARGTMTASELDDTVRAVLQDCGFADLIKHKTGHGLGLDVHEYPQIMSGNDTTLLSGMVFTIEPGLYKDGTVGIRIEDNVLVTDAGSTCLTSVNRDLVFVG